MVLTAAFEFDPRSNKEATIRPTDNIEVPQVKKKKLKIAKLCVRLNFKICVWNRSAKGLAWKLQIIK